MENCLLLIPVRSSRVGLLRSQRLCCKSAAGELCPHARGREQQFFIQFHNLYDYPVKRHDDYTARWHYNNWDYRYHRNHNNYFVFINGGGKQSCQPAAGELHPDAGGLHPYDNYFYNYWDNRDYRNNRHYRNYRNNRRHRDNDNRNHNKYIVIDGGGKQSRRPAAGDLCSHTRSLHSDNDYSYDYRDDWNYRDNRDNDCAAGAACPLKPDGR